MSASANASRFTARTRRRRLVRSLVVLAVVGVVAGAVWLVRFSSVLTVQSVRVTGVDEALEDVVIEAAGVPMGEALMDVDTSAITNRVSELPAVRSASVNKSWPSAVTISVSQREPVAIARDGSSWWRVDADGVLFRQASSKPDGLPVIEVPVDSDAGSRLARASAAEVVTALPGGLAERVDMVTAESAADIRLSLADGSAVVWGTSERSSDKAAVLRALIDDYTGDNGDVESNDADPPAQYDVSAPDRPAVTP